MEIATFDSKQSLKDLRLLKSRRITRYFLYLDHRDIRMHLVAFCFGFAAAGPDGVSLE